MGQSTIVAAAFSAAIFLFGIFVNISMNLNSMQTIATITDDKVAQIEQISSQRCKLVSWKVLDPDNAILNVTNCGEASIRLTDFKYIELFGLTILNGSRVTVRLPYNEGALFNNYWQISRVFFNGHEGERFNPLNVSSSSGSWDPDESIEVRVKMLGLARDLEYLTFVMPSGFKSSLGNNSIPLSGLASIESGSLSIVVQHGLRTIPSNVQLTPNSRLQSGFWVSNITSDTFTININGVEDHVVNFYWFIVG